MTIEQRLAKLERQNRWMKRAGGLMLAAVACVVLMGQGKPKELPDLVAKSLTIKDEKGGKRVELGTEKGSAYVRLHDQNGRVRLSLRTAANGNPHLNLVDQTGKKPVVLRTFLDGSVLLALKGLFLRSAANGSPAILLTGRGGIRAWLGRADDGSPVLKLRDAKGKVIWQAPPK